MFTDLWEARLAEAQRAQSILKEQTQGIDKQIGKLLDRIVDASSPSVVSAYEQRIEKLEREKLVLLDQAQQKVPPEGRLSADKARATEARVYHGQAAINAGLADRIGSLDGVLADLQSRRARSGDRTVASARSGPARTRTAQRAVAAPPSAPAGASTQTPAEIAAFWERAAAVAKEQK